MNNCLNHDFNKINKMNRINTFSTETQRTQSCTELRFPLTRHCGLDPQSLASCLNHDFNKIFRMNRIRNTEYNTENNKIVKFYSIILEKWNK